VRASPRGVASPAAEDKSAAAAAANAAAGAAAAAAEPGSSNPPISPIAAGAGGEQLQQQSAVLIADFAAPVSLWKCNVLPTTLLCSGTLCRYLFDTMLMVLLPHVIIV
jgi:hypothetical protein